MNSKLYDSPEDITSVDLTIQAASGNLSPVIYANGRNQLPIEIIAKATKENPDHSESVLHFSKETWIHILNLRHAESDEILTWQGNAGWCFTAVENDYSLEVLTKEYSVEPRYMEPGDTLITLYVYSGDISARRIAVSIDTDGGGHFTTADNSTVVERSSITVRALQPVSYLTSDLIQERVSELGKTRVTMHYTGDNVTWSKKFDGHYDNLYFSIKNKICNYTVNNYGKDGKVDISYPERTSQYWVYNSDQHMLVANPSAFPEGESNNGFYGRASWNETLSAYPSTATYDLFLDYKYNDRPKTICWTHFSFAASDEWILPADIALHVNDTDLQQYNLNPWFDFYDLYGNYGRFSIHYNSVSHEIEVSQK
ncbi:hypothetical protein [Erwinia amylovora]|uniref:hypothetical protein n=1 Tax=Erwinia amylovora TaxID=552 RepID=UPI0014438DB4|nr:hypothetical protein [Erwinia amylovora]